MRKSAAVTVVPKRDSNRQPRPIRTAAAMKVPIPPILLIHLPTPRPTMFSIVRKTSSTNRRGHGEDLVVRQSCVPRAQRKHRYADEVQHHRRHVQHVVGPVAPAGEKSVEVAEDFLGPQINAAFPGIAVRQFDDGDALRPEEETSEMSQSQTVTPPLAAIDGTTFRLKTATTNSSTRSQRPRTRFRCGCS